MASQLTSEDVGKMKVAELKVELDARGLSTKGLKKDLAERLLESIQTDGAAADPAAQDAGEAPEIAGDAQKDENNLPSEMPAVAPATVPDFEGTDDLLSKEQPVETSGEPSAVKKPDNINSVDQVPGVVQETATATTFAPTADGAAQPSIEATAPAGEMSLAVEDDAGMKRKRSEDGQETAAEADTAVIPPAVQEEATLPANDGVPAPPEVVDQPELKRQKTNGVESNGHSSAEEAPSIMKSSSRLAVADASGLPFMMAAPSDTVALSAEEEAAKSVPSATSFSVKGASSKPSSSSHPAADLSDRSREDEQYRTNGGGGGAKPPSFDVKGKARDVPSKDSFSIKGSSHATVAKTSASSDAMQSERGEENHLHSSTIAENSASTSRRPSSLSPPPPAKRSRSRSTSAVAAAEGSKADMSLDQEADNSSSEPPSSASICVSNLVRPFTLPALHELLDDYGDQDYFWINTIKSHCFVTYTDVHSAQKARLDLQARVWPEVTGKPLSITYVPTSTIPSLVSKEEAAGRTRLELVARREGDEWTYDVLPLAEAQAFQASNRPSNGNIPRGLASAVPTQARSNVTNPFPLGRPEQPPADPHARHRGSLLVDPNNVRPGLSGGRLEGGGRIGSAANEGGSSAAVGMKADALDGDRVWMPASGSASTYKRTKTTPELYYRPVDMVAAGRRLRELERVAMFGPGSRNSRGNGSSAYPSRGGRQLPSANSFRSTYRP